MATDLRGEIARYVGRGYELTTESDDSASLVKRKHFSFLAFIVLLVLGVLPGIIYVAWYASKKDDTIYLYLDDSDRVRRRGGKWTLGRFLGEKTRGVN